MKIHRRTVHKKEEVLSTYYMRFYQKLHGFILLMSTSLKKKLQNFIVIMILHIFNHENRPMHNKKEVLSKYFMRLYHQQI
jgi:hypothetical protein